MRVKGQESNLIVTGPAGLEEGLGEIVNFEVEFQFEILTESLVGQTSDQKDDIFKGLRLRMELQLSEADAFRFVQRVKDRSQRRSPAAERFDAVSTLNFPNGQTVRTLVEGLFFGAMPMRIGGRAEYVTLAIEAEANDGRFLFS